MFFVTFWSGWSATAEKDGEGERLCVVMPREERRAQRTVRREYDPQQKCRGERYTPEDPDDGRMHIAHC